MHTLQRTAILSSLIPLLMLGGCALPFKAPSFIMPPQPLTEQVITDYMNATLAEFRSMRASGTLEIIDQNIPVTSTCQVLVVTKGTDKILMRGYQPLIPNYFTFILNGGRFWYYIPRQDIVYTGTLAALKQQHGYELALHPVNLVAALLPPKPGAYLQITERTDMTTTVVEKASAAAQSPRERLFIMNNQFSSPRHITTYTPQGTADLEIDRTSFITSGTIVYPRKLSFVSANKPTEIRIALNNLLFNIEVNDSIFSLDIPAGVKIEEIGGTQPQTQGQ